MGEKFTAELTGLDLKTVYRGKDELTTRQVSPTTQKQGGDRSEKKKSQILDVLQEIVADDTTGDPQTGKKWIRRTLWWIREQLLTHGICASIATIRKYLRELGYSLRKKRPSSIPNPTYELFGKRGIPW